MKNNVLSDCQMTKFELIALWLKNYELGEPIKDIIDWTRFKAIDEFTQRLIMFKTKEHDEYFGFRLVLNETEEKALKEYLLNRKSFVVNYILSGENYSPYTFLHQLYLQYLPDELEEVEKSIFLDGYIDLLKQLHGENYAATRKLSLEKF